MVAQLEQAPHDADDDNEVSSCVLNLIQAFTNGLNIFKRLRETRRKRKAHKENRQSDRSPGVELQLSESLRRGPRELAQRYTECRAGIGRRFAKGDAIAHASLAETLIKLNTGLINIISTFLDHKNGKNHLDLDYKSLTNLSDISRREALHSMSQLYERLSQSQLQIYATTTSPCQCCTDTKPGPHSTKNDNPAKRKKKHKGTRPRADKPVVAKMPIKSSNEPQLVVIRPKTKRKSSHSSSNSNSVKSGASTTNTSPLASPVLKLNPIDPFEVHPALLKGKSTIEVDKGRQRVDSFDDPRPVPWPSSDISLTPEYNHRPLPELPSFAVTPRKHSSGSPSRTKPSPLPPQAISPIIKRRLDKATPSSYTFASDSTKLGEIPQRHWTTPWNYEEAKRLNTLVRETGDPISVSTTDKSGKKKSLFGFLRRGSTAGVAP